LNPTVDLQRELELAQHAIEGRLHWFEVDRRRFLQVLGGGLLVCAVSPAAGLRGQESGRGRGGGELPQTVDAWIHIGADGRVTVFTGKVEVGQNIRTSLSQQVAEELRVPVESIDLVMGDTDRVPYDMGTFGSRTTPTMGPQLRKAAARAREALIEAAAQRWKVEPATLRVEGGRVRGETKEQAISYGDLASEIKLVESISEGTRLTPASEWIAAGKPQKKVGAVEFVTGRHQYTSDLSRPGMRHGKVLRPSAHRGKLVSLDASAAEKISGVQVVRDGDFVGVVSADSDAAERAVEALKAEWSVPPQPSDRELWDQLTREQARDGGERERERPAETAGSVARARDSAAVRLDATYRVAYIAHAPLEPRAAVAEWNSGKLTVWTGTQRPFAVRDELAETFRIAADKVRVLVPDTGSAYGGKHTGDAAIEAARLARAAGAPVKVVWTREEEFRWAYFRPAGVIRVSSGATKDGVLTAWEFDNFNSGPAAIATPYAVANRRIQFHPAESPLRQGSYRGLAATANHFARESHVDELAHALTLDPLDFRVKNLTDARLKAVLTAAAEKFGWAGRTASSGRGAGLACGVEKGGYVATCAEIQIDRASRQVAIRRVVEAFECGAVVNPDGLRNQVEGAIVQSIGGALFEQVRFESGKITNPHLSQYRVPRFTDLPQIEVVLVDRKDLPSAGAGETPIVGLAPAVANAIFAASGVRLRDLPLVPQGLPAKT
jgi:CO/xanthine dehydrogenase Mo-binding subunit